MRIQSEIYSEGVEGTITHWFMEELVTNGMQLSQAMTRARKEFQNHFDFDEGAQLSITVKKS